MTTAAYDPDNIFAKIIKGDMPCHKIYEDDETLVFMDIMPRADGHCLVIPKAPSRNLLDIQSTDLSKLIKRVQTIAIAAKKAFSADGVTIQQFNETAGGQMVFHTHFHVIPRMDGVSLKPHSGKMADGDLLAAHCEKIKNQLKKNTT